MSLFNMVVGDHFRGGMISYVGEWSNGVPGLMGSRVGIVVMINIRGQYHVHMN